MFRYIEQELAVNKALKEAAGTNEAEIEVEKDEMGHYVDKTTGDIWDLEAQKIIGQKDLNNGKCSCHPEHENVSESSLAKLITQLQTDTKAITSFELAKVEPPKVEPPKEEPPKEEPPKEEPPKEEPPKEVTASEPVKKRSRTKK
jgi:hypothetical protein